jgi:hypothetical protein
MRAFLPLLALALLAAPVHAADQTEALHLTYTSAADAERLLLHSGAKQQPIIPAGIHAWTIDSQTNSLVVTGESAAIDQIRKVMRLIDIPPRKIRLHVRVLKSDAALDPLKARGKTAAGLVALGITEDADREVIQKSAILSDLHLEASNNTVLHVRPTGSPQPLALQPRLNGDSSVTFVVPGGADHAEPTVLVRLDSRMGMLLFAPSLGQTLFIEVEGLGP